MRRLLPVLLLAVPALAWAAPDAASTPRQAACEYSRPSAATGGGGGNEAEALAPRSRGTRWHSFLPGMFR